MKASEMKWREIKTGGLTFTPEQLAEAWEQWLRHPRRDLMALDFILRRVTGYEEGCNRTGDKMLQRARRAGVVRWNGKTWSVVEGAE